MTLPEFALNYKRDCSTEELRNFIVQRGGTVPRPHLGQRRCINLLRRLDVDAAFPFLSLLPELRLGVYELLLAHNSEELSLQKSAGTELRPWRVHCSIVLPPPSTAYPALLRASRQLYHEARNVLYRRSVLTLALQRLGQCWICRRTTCLHTIPDPPRLLCRYWDLKRITIVGLIDQDENGGCVMDDLQNLVRELVAVFRYSPLLELLKVIVRGKTPLNVASELPDVVEILGLLPSTTQVRFEGLPEPFRKKIQGRIDQYRKQAGA